MTDPSRHAESRNFLESLLRQIPGFRGYLEKEYRRESDQLARTAVAGHLQHCKTHLDQQQRQLVAAGQIDSLPRFESLRTRLDTLRARVQGAMKGYSGFFDFVRVDEAVLDRVYEHDLALIDQAQELENLCQQLPADAAGRDAGLQQIEQRLTTVARHLDERVKLLEGLK